MQLSEPIRKQIRSNRFYMLVTKKLKQLNYIYIYIYIYIQLNLQLKISPDNDRKFIKITSQPLGLNYVITINNITVVIDKVG